MNMRAPLVVICGPTASGKTSLAIRIAQHCNGEIISADSRAIYKGLDIGTAKPSAEEQQGVPHYGLDLVAPGEPFTAADFKDYALTTIEDIRRRGKTPILAGGTGLYIDSVIFDYSFPTTDSRLKKELENKTLLELYEYCTKNNIILPENYKNKRYVINTILRSRGPGSRRDTIIDNCVVVGIATDKDVLRERIARRAEAICTEASFAEAMTAAKRAGWSTQALTANIYRYALLVQAGTMDEDEAKSKFITLDWQLAKRQLTWFRRNEYIKWYSLEDAYTYVVRTLAKMNKS